MLCQTTWADVASLICRAHRMVTMKAVMTRIARDMVMDKDTIVTCKAFSRSDPHSPQARILTRTSPALARSGTLTSSTETALCPFIKTAFIFLISILAKYKE